MTRLQKIGAGGLIVLAFLVLSAVVFAMRPAAVAFLNTQGYITQKVDDATSYKTQKEVEDACRAYIASYEADKLRYLQYKDADSEEQRSWSEQAKMRANTSASTYNNYILKNEFVWAGNIPADIRRELEYLE